MAATIKIYTTPWDDINPIKNLLNSHLLRYRIFSVDRSIFRQSEKKLPIIEIEDELYYNPSVDDLIAILGLQKKTVVSYFDSIAIGGSIECFFYVDYQIKHNVQTIGITNKVMDITRCQRAYNSLFRLPNPLLLNSFYENNIISIEMLPTYRHFKIITEKGEVYTRSLFITLESKMQRINLSRERRLTNDKIFFDKQVFLRRLKSKRPRDPRKRIFAVVGNHPDILDLVFELLDKISLMYPSLIFEIVIISSWELSLFHPYMFKKLQKTGKVRIFEESHISRIEETKDESFVKVYAADDIFTVDFMLEYNKSYIDNGYVKDLFDFDKFGYIMTDHTYKTKHPSAYTIKPFSESEIRNKVMLLDRYVECAEIGSNIKRYIEFN